MEAFPLCLEVRTLVVQKDGEPLILTESPAKHLRSALAPGAFLIAWVAITLLDHAPWYQLLFIVVFLPSVGIRLWQFHLARTAGVHSRIDAEGVHWITGLDLPWEAVVEVRVESIYDAAAPLRRLHLRPNVVFFVTATQASFAARAELRPTGHAIFTRNLTVTAEQVVGAVRRFSDVPITRR